MGKLLLAVVAVAAWAWISAPASAFDCGSYCIKKCSNSHGSGHDFCMNACSNRCEAVQAKKKKKR